MDEKSADISVTTTAQTTTVSVFVVEIDDKSLRKMLINMAAKEIANLLPTGGNGTWAVEYGDSSGAEITYKYTVQS